jgi:hypothetical protein
VRIIFCDFGRLENRLPYTGPQTNKHPTMESPAEAAVAQSFLRQIKQEYHKRTVIEESAQVHNLLALRPCATEVCRRWRSKTAEQELPQFISRRDEEPSCSTLRHRSLMIETTSPIRSTLRAASFILFSQIFMRGSIVGAAWWRVASNRFGECVDVAVFQAVNPTVDVDRLFTPPCFLHDSGAA